MIKDYTKYWYQYFIGECPVCGKDTSYKERCFGKKPKNKKDRYVYLKLIDCYDHCLVD